MKEKLEEYSFIAQIISALAVVASLIFVGIGIRQNTEQGKLETRVAQVNAYQDLVSQVLDINSDLMTSPELMDVIYRARSDEPLTEKERMMVTQFVLSNFRHSDMACNQYRQGLITLEMMRSIMAPFLGNVWQIGGLDIPIVQGNIQSSVGLGECLGLSFPEYDLSGPPPF